MTESHWRNHEREFQISQSTFSKRSFRPDEYVETRSNGVYVPPLGTERLQNEAACLSFVRKHTSIPVPTVLQAYEDDGAFVLVTELLSGVQMDELSSTDQLVVMQEVQQHITTLQQLKAKRIGGPTGFICPPRRATQYYPLHHAWPIIESTNMDFVFCHTDLSQSNIIVNPKTLKIEGIIDWEHAGFWPSYFETHFFLSPRPSGAQFKDDMENRPFKEFFSASL